MAKKSFFAVVMGIIVAAFSFVSCEGSLDELNDPSHNAGYGIMKVAAPDDKIVDVKSENLKMRFVGDEVEYSFTHVDVYRDGGPIDGKKVSETYGFVANGTEPQYFDGLKTFEYVTNSGRDSKSTSVSKKGDWEVTLNTFLQPWNAANKAENHNFDHQAEGSAAAMVYSYYDEELGKGYAAKFPAPSLTISGEELSNERVSGVVYNGKVYEAIRYSYAWTVTATIPEAYRIEGEKYEDTREGINVAFFLLHEVATKLDKSKTNYIVNINSGERKLYQDPQTVHFELVTTDNGVETDRKFYDFEEVFNIVARGGENKILASEEALKAIKIESFNKGEIKSTNSTKDICSLKTFNFGDVITISDGNVINVEGIFEALGWNGNEFPYASTTSARTAVLSSVKNTALSSVLQAVYDVTLILTYPIVYNNSNKVGESKTIVIKWQDYAAIADDIETKDENMQYVIVTKVSESKDELIATEQFNSWNTNTYNRGVLQSSEAHRVDLPLSVKTGNGSSVSIKKEQRGQKVSVRAIDEGTASTTDSKVEGEDYTVRTRTRTATIMTSDGGKLPVTLVDGRTRKDGKDVLAYTEVKNLRVVSIETPVKNETLSSGENEVYDVKVNLAVDLEEKGSVQTRGAGDVGTEYLVANYQQTIGDELVSGSEEIIITLTPNGKGIDWKAEGYETWTLRGRVKVDEKSGRAAATFDGVDGDPIVVSNTNVETNGNGHNGTGKGTYFNNASNGIESFTNQFPWTADGSFDVTLNFTSGPKTKSLTTNWVIREVSSNVGGKSGEVSGYDVYPYSSTVEGEFSLADKSVKLSATANRQLRIKQPTDEYVSERVEKTVTKNGNGFDYIVRLYETWSLRGEFVKDEKSGRVAPSLTGRNGSAIIVSNTNFTTNGNGHNGTGNGVYTNNASNGVESFENQFDWNAPTTVNVTLNGTKGTRTETISTSWSIADAGQTIGSATTSNGYKVYPYTATVKGTYTVEGQSLTLTATAKRDLKVKEPINVPDLVPGKIQSAAITCVPANGDNASNYADGSNKRNAVKTLCIVTDEGAEPVPFAAWNNDNVVVPTNDEISSGNFVNGNYSTAYNSGYYQGGKWVPAIAKDNSWGISYSIPTQENIRSIRNETLKQWNWRNGNYSVFVDGYTFDVDADGVLTVKYHGEVVLQCK